MSARPLPLPRRLLPVLVALALAAAPVAAGADAFTRVENAYQRTGTIDACSFSTATLSAALRQEDTYATQYFQDFSTAVQGALNTRAGGICARGAGARPARPVGTLRGGGSPPPGSVTAHSSSGIPAPLAVLGVLAALVALGVAGWALGRGWAPLWAADWRHAWAEAGYRISIRWSDLADRRPRR